MTDVVCKVRLGAAFTATVPSIWRDEASTFTAEFTNRETAALVDVSGVTARLFYPTGAEAAAPTPAETSAGIWTVEVDPAYQGRWCLIMACTSPNEATASFYFMVKATEPDTGAPPDPTYYEAVALVDRAETAADGAEADADRAEAAQAAAESAVSTGTGPLYATSVVAATLDSNLRATNYTCVLPRTIQTGSEVAIEFPTMSGTPGITIRPTVASVLQSFYALRESDGTQITDGFFRAGVVYKFIYDGSTLNCLGEVVDEDIYATSIKRRRWFVPGDTQPRVTLEADTDDGELLGRTGGDGTTLPDYSWQIEADGSIRTLTGQIKTRRGVQVHNEDNPPDIADDLAHLLTHVPMPLGRDNRDVVAVDQTQPYVVTTERYLRVVQANTPLVFIGLQVNWDCLVEVQAGASAVAIAAPGLTWRSTASATQLAFSASSSYLVQRTQTQLYATQRPDFTTTSAAAAPSYARKVALLPAQSWGVHAEQDLWRGFQAEMLRLGLDPSVFPIQGIARGASPLLQSNDDSDHTEEETDGDNWHWWKGATNAAGPLLTDALAVLADASATGPGTLADLFCLSFLGISDCLINTSGVGMNDTGDCTIATWSAAHMALQAATRTARSLPSLPWLMIGLPNQPESVFTAGSLTAIRQAQLAVIAGDANTFRGAETWDLLRYDAKRHLLYESQRLLGLRLARGVAAALHGVNTYRGPKIVGVERASSDHKRLDVTIRRDPTSIGGTFALNRPTAPVGFGIIPASAGVVQGTRSTVKYCSWTTSGSDDVLQIITAADLDASPQLLFPDGFCLEARHRSRCVYANDGVTLMPLQAHRLGDYVT